MKRWFRIFDAATLQHICDMTGYTESDCYDPRIGGNGEIIIQPLD